MQGVWRKVVYVSLYELIAIIVASLGMAGMSGQALAHTSALAVMTSAIAVVWNLGFNHAFEWWEARQAVRGRSLRRRITHAVAFEVGLITWLVPVIAWWLDISLWMALVMDLGLVLFFLVYTFVFNWAFDRVFGLPLAAQSHTA